MMTMSDLIRRADAIENMCEECEWERKCHEECTHIETLKSLQPADAVEVVRCKDCKNRGSDACPMFFEEWFTIDEGDGYVDDDYREHDYTESDGYCHWGERKGGDEE